MGCGRQEAARDPHRHRANDAAKGGSLRQAFLPRTAAGAYFTRQCHAGQSDTANVPSACARNVNAPTRAAVVQTLCDELDPAAQKIVPAMDQLKHPRRGQPLCGVPTTRKPAARPSGWKSTPAQARQLAEQGRDRTLGPAPASGWPNAWKTGSTLPRRLSLGNSPATPQPPASTGASPPPMPTSNSSTSTHKLYLADGLESLIWS